MAANETFPTKDQNFQVAAHERQFMLVRVGLPLEEAPHSMQLKWTRQPITQAAYAIWSPERLRHLTGCSAALKNTYARDHAILRCDNRRTGACHGFCRNGNRRAVARAVKRQAAVRNLYQRLAAFRPKPGIELNYRPEAVADPKQTVSPR